MAQYRAIPAHWLPPEPNQFVIKPLRYAFVGLCIISVGDPSLENLWNVSQRDATEWNEHKRRVSDQMSNINLITSLLLASTGVFLTTDPPRNDLLPYTLFSPYACIAASFAFSLGGLIVGSAIVFVLNSTVCTAAWTTQIVARTRSRLCCMLVLLSYPFICIGSCVVATALGLIAAAVHSSFRLFKIGSIFCMVAPCLMVVLFVWTLLPPLHSQKHGPDSARRHDSSDPLSPNAPLEFDIESQLGIPPPENVY